MFSSCCCMYYSATAGHSDIAVFGMLHDLDSALTSWPGASKVSRKLQLQRVGVFEQVHIYDHFQTAALWRRWFPQSVTAAWNRTDSPLQSTASPFICPQLSPPQFGSRIYASLPRQWQICVEQLQQQTGVHWPNLFPPSLIHMHAPKCRVRICLSVGEVRGPQGTNSRSALWGWGVCQPIREPQRNSLWNRDQPTDRDTTQLQCCSAADKLYSPSFKSIFCVFKPISLCCQSRALPPAESTRSSGHQWQQGTDAILLRQYLQTSSLFFNR